MDERKATVLRAVVEGKGEMDHEGGALHCGEAGTEGVEGAVEEEEEWFEGFERVLKVVADAEVLFRAVELEETLVFAVQDVVEECDLGAQSFGETLAGKGGEVAKGAETPGVRNSESSFAQGFGGTSW